MASCRTSARAARRAGDPGGRGRQVRGRGLAYHASLDFVVWSGQLIFSLGDSADPAKALAVLLRPPPRPSSVHHAPCTRMRAPPGCTQPLAPAQPPPRGPPPQVCVWVCVCVCVPTRAAHSPQEFLAILRELPLELEGPGGAAALAEAKASLLFALHSKRATAGAAINQARPDLPLLTIHPPSRDIATPGADTRPRAPLLKGTFKSPTDAPHCGATPVRSAQRPRARAGQAVLGHFSGAGPPEKMLARDAAALDACGLPELRAAARRWLPLLLEPGVRAVAVAVPQGKGPSTAACGPAPSPAAGAARDLAAGGRGCAARRARR
jgi:hypothetical protein